MKVFLFGFSFLLTVTSAIAITGNEARSYMLGNQDKELHLATYALGLLDQEAAVILNARELIKNNLPVPVWPFCQPKGSNAGQMADIIKRAIYSEPENNHEPLLIISRRAISKVWECTKSQLSD